MSTEEALRPVCLLYGQPAILACLQKQKRAHFSGILATISIYQKPLYTAGLGLLDKDLCSIQRCCGGHCSVNSFSLWR